MAPKATCSAVILLGTSGIPVRVYPAVMDPPRISFASLCAKHGAQLKQQYICSAKGEIVAREDQAKGYELGKGRFLALTEEELLEVQPKAAPEIAILGSIELADIDPIRWSGSANYLGPDIDDGPVTDIAAVRAYAQLVAALSDASEGDGVVALGRWATRGTDKLVGIYRMGMHLILQGLRRYGEIRSLSEIAPAEPSNPGDLEVVISKLMLDSLDSAAWPDERYEATVKLLTKKAEAAAKAAEAPRKKPKRARVK
jgi:DNA end-binding protein Ku